MRTRKQNGRSIRDSIFAVGALGIALVAGCAGPAKKHAEPLARVNTQVTSSIMFVPVTINGRGPYWFELDTGFQNCAIERSLVKKLGLAVGPLERIQAPGGTIERATVTGARLAVAGQELADPRISSLDLTSFGPFFGRAPDGILGYDFLKQYVVVLDYENRAVEIYDPASYDRDGTDRGIALDTSSRQPYVTAVVVTADGRRAEGRFLIDTGSSDAVNLNTPFAERHSIGESTPRVLKVRGRSIGGETSALLTRVAALELGGVRFSDPVASIVEDAVDRAGQISGETLRRTTITFDYSRNRVFLKPNRAARDSFEFDMAGWYIVAGGADLRDRVVFLVLEGSPAAKSGVKEGDRIVSVDGRRAQDMGLDEIRRLFQVEKATRRVQLARGHRIVEVTLTLQKLL